VGFALLFIIGKPALPSLVFYAVLLGVVVAWWFFFKKIKHKLSFFLFIFAFLGSIWFTLHFPAVQTWLVNKVTNKLSKELHTKIAIKHIDFHFFDKLDLRGLYVEDLQKDTLLYAGSATIKVTDWFFLKDKVTLHYVALENAQVNMNRSPDQTWNYQFLIDYFSSPKKEKLLILNPDHRYLSDLYFTLRFKREETNKTEHMICYDSNDEFS